MSPIEHVLQSHDMALVLVAAAVCLAGGWATSRFFPRVVATTGAQRGGWVVLTALTCGVSVWCTHFIAMLAHGSSSAVTLDEPLTVLSLVIAIVGIGLGLLIAAARPSRGGAILGGLVVGAAVAGLHYTGMAAYRTDGAVRWDGALVALSIGFALVTPAVAMLAARRGDRRGRNAQWLLLSLSIVLLHFTGMAAFTADAGHDHAHAAGGSGMQMLVVFIAALGSVVVASGVAGYLIDHRGRAERDQQLRALASVDALTALPNRAGFTAMLDRELAAARDEGARLALLAIDLHGIAGVNERHGRSVGDEMLREAGRRLALLADGRGDVQVARVGGDEFAAIVRGEQGIASLLTAVERELTSGAVLGGGVVERLPGAAIGVAVYPEDARGAEALVAGADIALQRSKADPQERPRFYDRLEDHRTRTRRDMAADLGGARERGELRLRYRPQVEVGTRRVVGFEVLVHWEHPSLGPVRQHELLPLAQEHGAMDAIGDWLLTTACGDAALWHGALRVAVPVTAAQLHRRDLPQRIAAALEASGLDPDRLEIVIPGATAPAEHDGVLHTLRGLAASGVRIALDGSGSPSLALLQSLPVDRITIDGSSLDTGIADDDQRSRRLVDAVAGMGRALGVRVLAEGVQRQGQLEELLAAGVTEAQGPLLGRPVPGERLTVPVG